MDSKFNEKVKEIVVDVVKQDPQLLMDAMGEGISKKREEAVKQLAVEVGAHKTEIDKQCMKFGKLDSKKTIICFFDPLCKHCVEFQKNMVKLIEANKDVCFKLLPVDVLGDDSRTLARVYISAYQESPKQALKFIKEIISKDNEMDKNGIEAALKNAGCDVKKIEDLALEADKRLAENGKLAEELKLPVVPMIFASVGSQIATVLQTDAEQLLAALEDVAQGNNPSPTTTK
jgi:protein-disulfide isomerase